MTTEQDSRASRTRFVAAVVAAALVWSTSFTATKAVLSEIPPLTVGALRFTLAAAVLATVAAASGSLAGPTGADLGRMALGGVLGTTLYFSMENVGVDLATASDAALLVASYPAVTMGLEIVAFRFRASWGRFLGVALAMAGVYLIVGGGASASGPERLVGDLVLLAAGFAWAAYNFSTQRVGERYPNLTLVFYQTAAGAVAFWPLAFTEAGKWQAKPSVGAWLIVVYLGLFCSVVAFLFYAFGLRGLEAGSAVNLLNLVPVFGVAFAFLMLGEPVGLVRLLGGALVVAGVLLGLRSAGEGRLSGQSLADGNPTGTHSRDEDPKRGRRTRGKAPDTVPYTEEET